MVKSGCAPGCENRWSTGTALSFYRFPADQQRRAVWVSAVKRECWEPTEHSWLCSAHFVSGSKNNDPLSPDYVPSIFSHVRSPPKRKAEQDLHSYARRKEARRKRSEAVSRETACQVLLSFTGEEANEPAEIETVESRIVETGTTAETLGKDTETMTIYQ